MIDRAADEHTNGVCWQMLSVERILTLNDTLADGSSVTCVKARLKNCISSNVGTSTSITLQLHLTLNWQVVNVIATYLPIKKRLVDFQVLLFIFHWELLFCWDGIQQDCKESFWSIVSSSSCDYGQYQPMIYLTSSTRSSFSSQLNLSDIFHSMRYLHSFCLETGNFQDSWK